jgi:hypothetical protein
MKHEARTMKIDNVYELREAFWIEFLPWWQKNWRDLFGEPLTLSARYEYRDKRWNQFKARMVAEGRITEYFAKNALNP